MSPRPKLILLVTFFSCLLTLAASGDDVCVVRLVFVPESVGEIEFPLDDPNTDFLEPGALLTHQHPGWDASCGGTKSAADANAVRVACAFLRWNPLPVDRNLSLAALNNPLLC
jgi:hypothetical protein